MRRGISTDEESSAASWQLVKEEPPPRVAAEPRCPAGWVEWAAVEMQRRQQPEEQLPVKRCDLEPRAIARHRWPPIADCDLLPQATVAEAIERSGLGWRVEREPIALDRDDVATVNDWWLPRCEEIPGRCADVRQDTRQVLGIVGDRYRMYLQWRVMSGPRAVPLPLIDSNG